MLAVDMDYERLSGQIIAEETARLWSWEKLAYVERPCYVVSLGKQDGVRADADAAMTPDASLFGSTERHDCRQWLRERGARLAMDTDSRVYAYLQRHGPCTIVAMRTTLGLSEAGVRKSLLRRPDLFATVGEIRNKRNNIVPLWGIRSE